MICAEFERTKEGWKVDAEWRGYGNADMIEAFKMENIDIIGVLAKRGIKSKIVEFR